MSSLKICQIFIWLFSFSNHPTSSLNWSGNRRLKCSWIYHPTASFLLIASDKWIDCSFCCPFVAITWRNCRLNWVDRGYAVYKPTMKRLSVNEEAHVLTYDHFGTAAAANWRARLNTFVQSAQVVKFVTRRRQANLVCSRKPQSSAITKLHQK